LRRNAAVELRLDVQLYGCIFTAVPDVFEAVADPTRRRILEHLRTSGWLSVTELTRPLPMTRQAVSKHLSVLEAAGLIEYEWWGRERRHRLKSEPLREMDDWLAPYAAAWDRRLDRLRRYLMEDLNDQDD